MLNTSRIKVVASFHGSLENTLSALFTTTLNGIHYPESGVKRADIKRPKKVHTIPVKRYLDHCHNCMS